VSRSPDGTAASVAAPAALAGLGFLAALFRICDYDLWWHIRTGDLILDTGHVPKTDPFSHLVQGHAWVTHSWASDVLIALAARAGGPDGVTLAKCAVAAALAVLLWALARRAGAGIGPAFVAVVLVLGTIHFRLFERPHLATYLLLPVAIEETVQAGAGKTPRPWRRDLLLPALFLLWANLHVGFLLGLALLALAALVRLWRGPAPVAKRLAAVFGLSLLATLVNPHGYRVHLYPFEAEQALKAIRNAEWLPPTIAQFPMFFALLALLVVLAVAHRRRADLRWVLLVPPLVLALRSNRSIGELGVAAAVPLALLLTDTTAALRKRLRKRASVVLPALAALTPVTVGALHAGGVVIPSSLYRFGLGVRDDLFPVAAADYVDSHGLIGKMANTPAFGGYLIWRFGTERPVMADGRVVLYREANEALLRTPWAASVDQLGLTYAVLRAEEGPAPDPLLETVSGSPDWALLYWDDVATVWAKRIPEHADVIASDGYRVADPWRDAARVPADSLTTAVAEYGRAAETAQPFRAVFGLGIVQLRAEEPDAAEGPLERATALRPDYPPAWMMLAYARLRAGRAADALPAAHRAVELAPDDVLALRHLGVALYDLGRYPEALVPLERALHLAPGNPELMAIVGECRQRARGGGGR